MATLDDLEAQLRGSFDRETIAVYGDQLQAIGDPRGELIAIDLAIEDSGPTPALAIRRADLIDAWLGLTPPNGVIRHGFVDVDATSADPVAQVRAAFDGPAAPHVRSVTMCGPPKLLAKALGVVAGAPRPSLVRLAIRQWDESDETALPNPTTLIAATPHLRSLDVDGRNVFPVFPHPNLRRLKVTGWGAIRSLADGRLVLPELTDLDLALHSHLAGKQQEPSGYLFAKLGEHMPKLVDLDLSRNEPGYRDPKTLGGGTNVFQAVLELAIGRRLRTLRVPATANAGELATIRALFPQVAVST